MAVCVAVIAKEVRVFVFCVFLFWFLPLCSFETRLFQSVVHYLKLTDKIYLQLFIILFIYKMESDFLQNYPLFIKTIPTDNELKFYYTVHTSLDVVEEKISSVGKNTNELRELYLGLLYPTEDYKVYPFIYLMIFFGLMAVFLFALKYLLMH